MVDSTHSHEYHLFREILIGARKSKGLSQAALAEKLGRLQTFVSKYERGERRLDVIEFLEVASALGLDAHQVLQKLKVRDHGGCLAKLTERIAKLSDGQVTLLDSLVDTFEQDITANRLKNSDVASDEFLAAFGDMLKLHHTLSLDYLDKHRFEAVMERICRTLGHEASRPPMNNPGHDLTIDGVAWSLKTQGDRNIKRAQLHIFKFMELGKGKWKTEKDLYGLRDMFLEHMNAYSRIFQLRYFPLAPSAQESASHYYELVEIPKSLLAEAKNGTIEMMHKSRQNPKPGYCTVSDSSGHVKFKLYFDGGTERKLQIKNLRKDLCVEHANWKF